MNVRLVRLSDMTFGQTGFRFLRIDFPEKSSFAVKSIVAACDDTAREESGKFTCSDDRMNEIWQTAAYTLKLCLKNGYVWDGIKRDRLVWIGDIYPETKTSFCLYPDVPEIKNSLIFCRDQTDEGVWMNGIPNYSAWWIYNLYEYYMRTSDEGFVKENLGFVKRIVRDFYPFVDEELPACLSILSTGAVITSGKTTPRTLTKTIPKARANSIKNTTNSRVRTIFFA